MKGLLVCHLVTKIEPKLGGQLISKAIVPALRIALL